MPAPRRTAASFRLAALCAAAFCLTTTSLVAQATPPDSSSPRLELYQRAQALVGDGNVAEGRALVDSLMQNARIGTPEYAEALYWRAALAGTAAEAERDYLRVTVEYSSSPHAEDALLRLGMLELARGDRRAAIRRFDRIVSDHPTGRQRARAQYWMGRTYFEENRVPEGCGALIAARGATPDDQVELVTQIDYYAQRCRGVAAVPLPAAGSTASSAPPTVAAPVTPAPAPVAAAPVTAAPAPSTPPTTAPPVAAPAAPRPAPATVPARPAAGPSFSVQVAAFPQRLAADRFAARLRERGFEARVDGTVAPFRVRIDRLATRQAATARLAELKRQKIDGYVVEVDGR